MPTTELNIFQSFASFMSEGGAFMWVILALWIFGLIITADRVKALYKYDLDGTEFMSKIKQLVLTNKVYEAIGLCTNTTSLLPKVIRCGLKRANQSRENIQDAIEAGILENIPKIETRMNYLSLVANVSTLFGLLGTIVGLIESFSAVATADPSTKAKLLALGISKAMNTTALGLLSAISIMVIHTILTNKGEKIIAEIDEHSHKIVDLLNSKKLVPQQTNNNSSEESNEAEVINIKKAA